MAFAVKPGIGTPRNSMVVGFILARPEDEFVKSTMLPHLKVWHHYSDNFTHFFWLGYHTDSDKESKSVARVDGNDWFFDDKTFVEDLKNFTENGKWQYNGGATAFLVNARRTDSKSAELDFRSAMPLDLNSLAELKTGALSPDKLFFQIFNFAKELNETNSDAVAAFSRSMIAGSAGGRVIRLLLSLLPESVKFEFQQALAFSTQNLAGRN